MKSCGSNRNLIEYKALSVEKVYFGNVDSTDSFLIVFEIHILDLIDGLLVSVMKKLMSVAPIVTKYWDFYI